MILRSSPIPGYPYHVCSCPGSAVIEQNGRETDFPDPVPARSVHPGVILGSARTQRYPKIRISVSGLAGKYGKRKKTVSARFALLRPNQGTYRHGRGTQRSGLTSGSRWCHQNPEFRIRTELEPENRFSYFDLLWLNQGTYRHLQGTCG